MPLSPPASSSTISEAAEGEAAQAAFTYGVLYGQRIAARGGHPRVTEELIT